MHPFRYRRASTIDAAVTSVADDPGAAFVAGGTEILNWLKDDIQRATLLVDINGLALDRMSPAPRRFANGIRSCPRRSSSARRPRFGTWGPSAGT
jgi:CO/xanthine dehydrogenase FAD-binding subunit